MLLQPHRTAGTARWWWGCATGHGPWHCQKPGVAAARVLFGTSQCRADWDRLERAQQVGEEFLQPEEGGLGQGGGELVVFCGCLWLWKSWSQALLRSALQKNKRD